MNDHTIYKGTGIRAAKKHDCMVKICAVQGEKSSGHVLTEEPVCCRHNLKEKKVYSLSDHYSWRFLLLFDDIYDSMIIMILFIMDIILNI